MSMKVHLQCYWVHARQKISCEIDYKARSEKTIQLRNEEVKGEKWAEGTERGSGKGSWVKEARETEKKSQMEKQTNSFFFG